MANLLSCDSGHDAIVVYIGASGYRITECPLCAALKEIEDPEAALKAEKDRE